MSYLDSYGVKDARREKLWKFSLLAVLGVVVLAVLIFFWLRDRSEKQQVEGFLSALRARDYKAAYKYWGCSFEQPCRDYAFDKFLEDWGPSSPHNDANAAERVDGQHCKSGRIEVVRFPKEEVQLWVERKTQTLGFAPWPIDFSQKDVRSRLRRALHDLAGDCAPPPQKVP